MIYQCTNMSGHCVAPECVNTESSLWYGKKGSKKCKKCYDRAKLSNKRSRGPGTPSTERVDSPPPSPRSPATIYKIKEIYGLRYFFSLLPPARPLNPLAHTHRSCRVRCARCAGL